MVALALPISREADVVDEALGFANLSDGLWAASCEFSRITEQSRGLDESHATEIVNKKFAIMQEGPAYTTSRVRSTQEFPGGYTRGSI